jgi:TolB protein
MHVLAVTQQSGTRRGYDIYLAARDSEELGRLRPVLDAMLTSARLSSSAGEPYSGPGHPDWAAYTSQSYRVTLEYPANWQSIGGEEEKRAGPDGFFELAAVNGGGQSLAQVCDGEVHHVLQPYGTRPTVEYATVAGQEACWILPSPDQPADMNGQAALIARYPQRVTVAQQPYEFVVLWADRAHIRDIGGTLGFLPPGD